MTGFRVPMSAVSLLSVPTLLLGDSTMYGIPDGAGLRNHLLNLARPPYLLDWVGPNKSTVAMRDEDHAGYPSYYLATLDGMAAGLIASYHPRIILLSAGINDVAQTGSAATATTRLLSIMTTIYVADPTIVTIVAQQAYTGADSWAAAMATYLAAVPGSMTTRRAAGQLCSHADLNTGVSTTDGVHPDQTATGYPLQATRFYAAMQAYAPCLAAMLAPVA